MASAGGVEIGDDVRIATHTVIVAATHRFQALDVPIREQGVEGRKIVIEDDVWIGANVCILGGVTVGSGAVIGAGSVVTRSVPRGAIAAGNPARVIGTRLERAAER